MGGSKIDCGGVGMITPGVLSPLGRVPLGPHLGSPLDKVSPLGFHYIPT